MIRALAPLLMALAPPAGAFDLAFPADCTLGQDCYIQQYHDHDPGPEATDYTCGPLSYDGHDGTDIALPTRAAMAAVDTDWMQARRALLAQAPTPLQESFIQRFQALEIWEQGLLLSSLQRISSMMNADAIDAAPVLSVRPLTEERA